MSKQRERALRTRGALLRAAAEVFAEEGYARASVTKITSRAGLTMGAMYFHFKGKAALAREIVLGQPERVLPRQASAGLQRVVDITLTWAHQLLDDPILLAGARLVMEQEEFVSPEQNSHQQWTRIIEDELATARERGELRDGVDLKALARLIVNACTGAQLHAQMASGRRDLPERIAEMWHYMLPAMARPEVLPTLDVQAKRGRLR